MANPIRDPRLEELYRYWRRKRGGGLMPSRSDIDPLDFPAALWPHILLLDVLTEDGRLRFRYRRVGGEFWNAERHDATGRYVDEMSHWLPSYRNYVVGFYRETVERRQPLYTSNLFTSRGDSAPLVAERVTLPLGKDGQTPDMIMTGHVFHYPRRDRDTAFSLADGVEEYARAVLD